MKNNEKELEQSARRMWDAYQVLVKEMEHMSKYVDEKDKALIFMSVSMLSTFTSTMKEFFIQCSPSYKKAVCADEVMSVSKDLKIKYKDPGGKEMVTECENQDGQSL